MYADVGPERPAGMLSIAWRTPLAYDPQGEGGEGSELVQNLEGIARGIPDYACLADVPLAYQRHTVGVSSRLRRILGQVIRAISRYHEHHCSGYTCI